eukprot:jgi/Mesen1/5203/ME000258S04300
MQDEFFVLCLLSIEQVLPSCRRSMLPSVLYWSVSVPCQKAGAPWLGLRTGGMASAPAVAWHGRPLGHSDKKVGGASGRGDAPAVRLQCFAKKSSKSDWEKEVDKWRSTTSDWEKEVDKWRSRSNRWQGRRFRGGGRKGGGGGLRGRRGRSLGGLGMAAGAIAGLAALTAGAAALTAGVAVASTAVLFPLVIPLVLGTGAVIFAGAVASLAAGLALVVPLVALSFAFLGPFGGLFRLLLPLPLPFGAIGPAVDKLFCFVIVANFLGALGGAYTRSRSAAAPGGAGSGRPLSRGQEAAALLLDMQPLAPELFKNCLVYGAPALSFLLASAVLPGFTLFGGGYFLGNGWWLSLLLGAVHLQLERIRVNDCLAAAGGRTLEGMTAGGEAASHFASSACAPCTTAAAGVHDAYTCARVCCVLSVEELEAMHRQGELESFDQRLNMRATAGGAAARLRPRDWTVGDVARWLQENGFARYAAAFLEHDVSGEVLLGLTAEELREELGMKSLGERKRFVAALESVQAEERVD